MADSRCFIQLHHPGWEHGHACAENWHSFAGDHAHQRKFLEFHGAWTDAEGQTHPDELHAWGEWEAESVKVSQLEAPGNDSRQFPSSLWRPHYTARADFEELHNTDPFIFGDHFVYSNCAQRRGSRGPGKTLKQLARGSLVVFGSCVDNEWVLDTVFVVAASVDYRAESMKEDVAGLVPQEFIDVTAEPIVWNESPDLALRLYTGATPSEPVDDMFSFFPAAQSSRDAGFKRPSITLPSRYFKRTKCQGFKQTCDASPNELFELWTSLVDQVRDAGLVLGTHAELPERRDK